MLALLAGVGIIAGVAHAIDAIPPRPVRTWAGAPEQAGPPVAIERRPERYRITYRVDTGATLGTSRSDVVLSVARPFMSRTVTTSARGRHELLSDETSTLGRHVFAQAKGAAQVLAQPADLATGDVRLDVALDQLVVQGLLLRHERRVVLGRPCQVYRSSAPLGGGSLAAPGADTTDSCVDAAGLVLAEVQRSGGKVTRQQVATAVDEHPTFAADLFPTPDPTVPATQGGASFVPVGPSSRPAGRSFVLDAPPAGFTSLGRYADVSAPPTDTTGNPSPSRRAGFSDVYVRGSDVVVLDQGANSLGGPTFTADPNGRTVDLGPLGQGEAIAGTRLQVVRAKPGGGSPSDYVRVAGTLPTDQLAAIARTLRAVTNP